MEYKIAIAQQLSSLLKNIRKQSGLTQKKLGKSSVCRSVGWPPLRPIRRTLALNGYCKYFLNWMPI